MQINVSGRHLDVSPTMDEYAQKKCGRLDRFYDRIQSIDVVLLKPGREFDIEIIAHVDHHDPFIAQVQADDYHAAIDQAVDKLSRQLTEHKNKTRNRKHPG
jgi:putative sigma-54 modulation protein